MTQKSSSGQSRDSAERHALQVRGDRVVLGDWSADLEEMIAKNAELREMLRDARYGDARALVQAESAEAQAALVAMDENPEEVLSLTGMDEKGRPGYKPEVVNKLPTDVFAGILAPGNAKLVRFNTDLLEKTSPEAFARAVDDTLDPVYFHGTRAKVSWEWLEAVAALKNDNKMAELLFKVDQSVLEDALITRIDAFDMHVNVASGANVIVAFRLLADSGQGVQLPPVRDPEVAEVIHVLHRAAPELMAKVIRAAWERSGGVNG